MEPMLLVVPTMAGAMGAAIAALWAGHRRRRARLWLAAAREAGLGEIRTEGGWWRPAVRARDGDLEVRLESADLGSEGSGTRLIIRGQARAEGAITIRREGLRARLDRRLRRAREIELGHEATDSEWFIEAPAALALAVLTRPVRGSLRRLLRGWLRVGPDRELKVRASLERGVLQVEVAAVFGTEAAAMLPAALTLARALQPPGELVPRLVENLRGERSAGVRRQIVATLGREFREHPLTTPALLAARADRRAEVRVQAGIELGAEGRETLMALVAAEKVDLDSRVRALRALGAGAPLELAQGALLRGLGRGESELARASLEALALLRRPEAEPLALEALEAEDASVRLAAALALRGFGTMAAIEPLRVLERGTEGELRRTARSAIAAIQSRLPGAAPGQLALADALGGALSLHGAAKGELSLSEATAEPIAPIDPAVAYTAREASTEGAMEYRQLGRTDMRVSVVSFGAWAIGGTWGPVDDEQSMRALHAAIDAGTNFVDTADVYGDGRSERLVARLRRERPGERIFVATKAGRRLPQQTPEGYSRENLTAWVERSLRNLEMDAVDLLQLHCPHPAVYDRPEVFAVLDELVKAGKIRYYGISVETVDEALRGIRQPQVQTVQIIFNMMRLKPAEAFFPEAVRQKVGILARVPLASGLLTGKLRGDSQFSPDDHRRFNRNGEAFDKGETFSGVPYQAGLDFVERLRPLVPPGATMAQLALRWILQFEAVSCAIPGAKTPEQARANAAAAALAPLPEATLAAVRGLYDERLRPLVHASW